VSTSTRLSVIAFLSAALGLAQTNSLQISSAAVASGSTVPLTITLASGGATPPAALQWDLQTGTGVSAVSVVLGTAGASAGKSLQCSGVRCLLYGVNTSGLSNGVVATLNVILSPAATGNIALQLINLSASAADGGALPISAQPGSISVLTPVAVTVSPTTSTLAANQTQQFTATVTGGSGNTAMTWSVNPSVGSVSSTGLYTAPASITAQQAVTVIATSVADGTKTASAVVTLLPLVSVTVGPATATLAANQTMQFTATVTGGSGNTAVTWNVNPNVGSVSSTGLYTAPASITTQQTVTVTATSVADGTKTASAAVALLAPVNVTLSPSSATLAANQTQQFTATVTGGSGNTAVTWSVSPSVGSVSSAGLYTAPASINAQQTVTVTATSVADGTKTASAAVTLLAPVNVTLSPATTTLAANQTQQFTATVTGGSGITALTWSVNPSVGSVSSTGLYTAPASITAQQTVAVTATSVADGTKAASAAVTLLAPVNVTLSPATATLAANQTQQFAATVTGGVGNTAVTWSVNPSVGSVSSTGLYTAPASITAQQTVTVAATSVADATKTASAVITLLAPVNVTLSPATATLAANQTQQFTATVTGGSGNTAVTWSVNPSVGSVSSTGLYTAPASITAQQTVTVTAISVADGTKAASAAVTLLAPVNVTLSPSTATLAANQTQQFTASVTGGSGNTAVTWSVSPRVGSVSSTGLYTAPASISAQQTVTVTATSVADGTKSASATITLLAPASVTVSPTTASLSPNQTQQFTASVTGGSGNTAVTWSVSPSVGIVSSTGLFTAPASISAQQTVTVTATSVVDGTKSASATITLLAPVGVTVNPATASLSANQTQQLTANVTGGSGNTAVTWSVSPSVGTVSSTGLYTAPVSISARQTVTVTATSAADGTKTASAVITLLGPASVTISPATATLAVNQTQQFTAALTGGSGNTTVSWSVSPSVGSVSSTGLYSAPSNISAPHLVQAVANAPSGSASSFSLSFPSNTTAGDLILVAFDFTANASLSSITDSQGNTFTEVGNQLTSPEGASSRVYYAKNVKGGADTVTIKLSAVSSWIEAYLTEYAGVDPLNPIDAQAGASGKAGAVSSGNATTTAASDLIYGFCVGDWVCTVGTGFSARSTFHSNLVEDKTSGNPGAWAATGSANNGWTMQMVALKPVSSVTVTATSVANPTTVANAVVTLQAAATVTAKLSTAALVSSTSSDHSVNRVSVAPHQSGLSILSCFPVVAKAGSQTTCEIQIAPSPSPVPLSLASSSPEVKVPAVVTTRPNQSSLTFQVSVDPVAKQQTAMITAVLGDSHVESNIGVAPAVGPVLTNPASLRAASGRPVRFSVAAVDPDDLSVQLTAGPLPAGASFDPASGVFTWTPTAAQQASYRISFTATNAAGHSAKADTTLVVDRGMPALTTPLQCSPNARVSVEGEWLAERVFSEPSGSAFELVGVSVKVNGQAVPILFLSPTNVSFLCPGLEPGTPLSLVVETPAGSTLPLTGTMQAAWPTILSLDGSHQGQGMISFAGTNELVMERNFQVRGHPAQPGDDVVIWATGLGDRPTVQVRIAGSNAEVESVQPVSAYAGVFAVQVRVPLTALVGDAEPVLLEVATPNSQLVTSNVVTADFEAAR